MALEVDMRYDGLKIEENSPWVAAKKQMEVDPKDKFKTEANDKAGHVSN